MDQSTDTPKKIIIVEDNISLADIYKTRLELLGHTCVVANDGISGLHHIKEYKPDLVLLDMMVPEIAGDEVLRHMRASTWGKNTPVIIVSNLDESEAPAGLRELGIAYYAVKANLSDDQLDRIVTAVLNGETLTEPQAANPSLLPESQPTPVQESTVEAVQPLTPIEQDNIGSNQKIVIVEDNVSLAEVYQTRMELLGYTCFVTHDGEEALKIIEKELPDLVLLDLMIPKVAGDQVLARMRNSSWGKSISVLIISNLDESEAPAGIRSFDISGYAVKANLTNDQLDQLVDNILKPAGQSEDVSLETPTA